MDHITCPPIDTTTVVCFFEEQKSGNIKFERVGRLTDSGAEEKRDSWLPIPEIIDSSGTLISLPT